MALEEAIKHTWDVAENNSGTCEECVQEHKQLAEWLEELKHLREQVKRFQWVPLKVRPTTEEDEIDMHKFPWFLDFHLPEDGERILVSRNGYVDVDENVMSEVDCYLDSWGDWADVEAWMPLPEPYRGGDEK